MKTLKYLLKSSNSIIYGRECFNPVAVIPFQISNDTQMMCKYDVDHGCFELK